MDVKEFKNKEEVLKFLDKLGNETVHVVKTDGQIKFIDFTLLRQ